MAEQSPDPDLKENNYKKWVEGQSTKELELELGILEVFRVMDECADPEVQMNRELAEREERRQELLAKIHEKDPKKRRKAIENVEAIMVEEYDADGPQWIDHRASLRVKIAILQNELQARRIQELSKGKAGSALAGARKLRRSDLAVAARRAVVQANADLRAPRMCAMLDDKEIPLPDREPWDSFRSHASPWAEAYRTGGKKFRRRIRVIISKDKKS